MYLNSSVGNFAGMTNDLFLSVSKLPFPNEIQFMKAALVSLDYTKSVHFEIMLRVSAN